MMSKSSSSTQNSIVLCAPRQSRVPSIHLTTHYFLLVLKLGCDVYQLVLSNTFCTYLFLVCVTVIYISLMIFGLLGNILTILVVWLRPHMRSSTYLYLSSMAVSDLLILLLLPLDLYKVHAHKALMHVHSVNS